MGPASDLLLNCPSHAGQADGLAETCQSLGHHGGGGQGSAAGLPSPTLPAFD